MDDVIQIKPYDKNTKQHEKKQLLQLAKIVAEVGWRQPVRKYCGKNHSNKKPR